MILTNRVQYSLVAKNTYITSYNVYYVKLRSLIDNYILFRKKASNINSDQIAEL